jgi:hypothetical protein
MLNQFHDQLFLGAQLELGRPKVSYIGSLQVEFLFLLDSKMAQTAGVFLSNLFNAHLFN